MLNPEQCLLQRPFCSPNHEGAARTARRCKRQCHQRITDQSMAVCSTKREETTGGLPLEKGREDVVAAVDPWLNQASCLLPGRAGACRQVRSCCRRAVGLGSISTDGCE